MTQARGLLDRVGGALRPAILQRQHDAARDRLEATWRLVESLDPNKLLDRGYVRVTARPSGDTLVTAQATRSAGAVTLHFRDGPVDAKVERGGAKAYDRNRDPADQPSLL